MKTPFDPAAAEVRLSPATARQLVWLAGLSHAANHYVMLIFPAVLLLIQQETGLGYAGLGLIVNLGLFTYGLGALPAGILADRIGGARILAVWLLGGSLACAAIALSAGPGSLAASFAVLGLFASLHHPAGSGVLVLLRQVPGQQLGRAFGLSGLLGNLGLASSPVVSALLGVRWGWRSAFWMGVLPGLLLGPALWRLPVPRPSAAPPSTGRGAAWQETWRAMTAPLLLLFALETLLGFIFQGFSTFFPVYLAEHGRIPGLTASAVARGGTLASLALLFGGVGHLLAGRLMGHRQRAAFFGLAMALTALCLFGMAFFRGPVLVGISVATIFAHFAMGTMSNTFIAAHIPPRLAGVAFGIAYTLALCVGSLAAGSMGFVAELAGLPQAFAVLGCVAVGALAIVVWFVRATANQPASPPSRIE